MSALPFARPEPAPREPRFRYEARRGAVAVFTEHGAVEVDLGKLIVEAGVRRDELAAMIIRYAHSKGVSLRSLGWGKNYDARGSKKEMPPKEEL